MNELAGNLNSAWQMAQRRCERAHLHAPEGVVLSVSGMVVEIGGLRAPVGATLEAHVPGVSTPLPLEVVGFRSGHLLTTPLGNVQGIQPGSRARVTGRGASVAVGERLLGRILDAFGRPLDGGGPLNDTEPYPLHRSPPSPFERRRITQAFATGVRALDGLLTLGVGQRVGVFAGPGVGKSTLLGMICRNSRADINVVGLIGERGREVNDFVRSSLGSEGLERSVVIAATSDQPPLVRAHGAQAATSVAEYFRDRGLSVLLVMDSVTRFAMAMRETALAAGEPPATKGYPPSVFAALPRLLERTGTCHNAGVITALYTVFVEGDDLGDPVADAVRGILDGHIVLSRNLAEKGHYPAIDVLQSISRLSSEVTDTSHQRLAQLARGSMGTFRDAEDLIQVGAYVNGSDPRVDGAIALQPRLEAYLRQGVAETTGYEEAKARLQSALSSLGSHRPA